MLDNCPSCQCPHVHIQIFILTVFHKVTPPTRYLRSSDTNPPTPITRTKQRAVGDRALAVTAPILWKTLRKSALHTRSFKKTAQNHLLNKDTRDTPLWTPTTLSCWICNCMFWYCTLISMLLPSVLCSVIICVQTLCVNCLEYYLNYMCLILIAADRHVNFPWWDQ